MYELFVEHHFSSAHRLMDYPGECSKLHGHNWLVKVYVRSDKLNEIGISIDFKIFKTTIKDEIDKLDHVYLNELPDFKVINPTAENICRFLFEKISVRLNTEHLRVHMVEVWESETHGARYFES